MQQSARQIAINNYHEIIKSHSLTAKQQMVLEFFWMFPKQKFTVDQVVEKFKAKYGDRVTKDNIAPRITELCQKGLLFLAGETKTTLIDFLTGKPLTIKRGEYQLTDLSEQPSLFI